jgi:hypothetical protein
VWDCPAANPDPECPAALPNLGTVCAPNGKTCSYGCEQEANVTCQNGLWIPDPMQHACPVSTRRAKRDVVYLRAHEVDALARAVQSTRLSTYEYTDPALAGPRHLGFIIEDQPAQSFAVNPERNQVDLYGYTSMLVAAVQSQQREIEQLRAQVRALESHTRSRH